MCPIIFDTVIIDDLCWWNHSIDLDEEFQIREWYTKIIKVLKDWKRWLYNTKWKKICDCEYDYIGNFEMWIYPEEAYAEAKYYWDNIWIDNWWNVWEDVLRSFPHKLIMGFSKADNGYGVDDEFDGKYDEEYDENY